MDYLSIGSSPPEEDCAQVGDPGYHQRAKQECARYLLLLRKACGEEPPGARLAIKSFPHNFDDDEGQVASDSYLEVVVEYDENDEQAADYALHLESNGPATWDGAGAKPWRPKPPAVTAWVRGEHRLGGKKAP